MNLITPTTNLPALRAEASPEFLASLGEEEVFERLADDLRDAFEEAFGSPLPPSWVSIRRLEAHDGPADVVSLVGRVTPPQKATRYFNALRYRVETSLMTLTEKSRISITTNPYRYSAEMIHFHPEHFLSFKGWDADTGLMVFGR